MNSFAIDSLTELREDMLGPNCNKTYKTIHRRVRRERREAWAAWDKPTPIWDTLG